MTADARRWGLGQLGRRLLAAFLLVALSSVAVLTAAALFGTARGISASAQQSRDATAAAAADAVATAYVDAGGWTGANLNQAEAIAASAGLQLVVQQPNGTRSGASGIGPGEGVGAGSDGGGAGEEQLAASNSPTGNAGSGAMTPGASTDGAGDGPHAVTAPVVVEGTTVGLVRLVGSGSVTEGTAQRVAWTWILVAAGVAVAAALVMAWFVSRRLSAPLTDLTDTTRAFATGDRSVRPSRRSLNAPGELGELARSFSATADIVSRYELSRRRMTSDIAHEIRTPLSALQAGLEEVRDGLVPADAAVLTGLHAQSQRLARIIDDLSQLSEAETAELSLHLSRVDLATLVADAVAAATPALHNAGMTVEVEGTGPVVVEADAGRIHQALSNLLMNTVRHCRAGDRVTVTTAIRRGDAVVTVTDDGPGIAAADLPHVFDRLWRGTTDSDRGGLGIGLAVVQAVAHAHRGTVEVASDATGTTFTLRLPLVPD